VDGLRHDLLAGATLAGQEHGGPGGGHLVDQPADLVHCRRPADEIDRGLAFQDLLEEVGVLSTQSRGLQSTLDQKGPGLELERFLDVLHGAELHGADGIADVAERRDDDDRELRLGLAGSFHQVDTGPVREPDVGDQEVEQLAAQPVPRTTNHATGGRYHTPHDASERPRGGCRS
jgi:hypothetical protein